MKVSHGRVGSTNEVDGSTLGRSPLASRKGVVREDRSEGSETAKSGTDVQEWHKRPLEVGSSPIRIF